MSSEYSEDFCVLGVVTHTLFSELEKGELTEHTINTFISIAKSYSEKEEEIIKRCIQAAGVTEEEFQETYTASKENALKILTR